MKKPIYQLPITNYLSLVLALLTIGYWLLTPATFAQTNTHVILTWQANNFYPANYEGKPLATPNTPITVSAETVIDNKLFDLNQAEFIWYVDEKFNNRGYGLKEILFTATKSEGDNHFVRVVIKQNNKIFEASTRIPIAKPLIIIESPYPNQLIRAESQILLQAIPYFFNINSLQDLSFFWQINEKTQKGATNQLTLKIGTPQTANQRTIQIIANAQNILKPAEFAKDSIKLFIAGY